MKLYNLKLIYITDKRLKLRYTFCIGMIIEVYETNTKSLILFCEGFKMRTSKQMVKPRLIGYSFNTKLSAFSG